MNYLFYRPPSLFLYIFWTSPVIVPFSWTIITSAGSISAARLIEIYVWWYSSYTTGTTTCPTMISNSATGWWSRTGSSQFVVFTLLDRAELLLCFTNVRGSQNSQAMKMCDSLSSLEVHIIVHAQYRECLYTVDTEYFVCLLIGNTLFVCFAQRRVGQNPFSDCRPAVRRPFFQRA